MYSMSCVQTRERFIALGAFTYAEKAVRKNMGSSYAVATAPAPVSKDGLLAVKWMDKRQVTMISTIHDDSMAPVQRRSRFADGGREVVEKPKCILEYNRHMGGVDLSDQLTSYHSFGHRTVKWWRRVFFHLIDTTIVNAYILYKESTQSTRKLTHVNFRVELAKGLL